MNEGRSNRDILRGALARGEECPPLDELLRTVTEQAHPASAGLARHVDSCPHCQTELHLWETFEVAADAQTSLDVREVTARLDEGMAEVLKRPDPFDAHPRWWERWFAQRWLAPASLAMASLLLVAGTVLQYRRESSLPFAIKSRPNSSEVTRSSSFAVLSPTGDLPERPKQIRWESVSSAARYQIRLLEVDGTELWKTDTPGDQVEIPSDVRSRMVPAKTVFCEVTAFDATGHEVGNTGPVRMRVMLGVGSK